MRIAAALWVVTITLVTARHARADDWYGWKLYPSDAVAATLAVVGDRVDSGEVEFLAFPIYLFVPPIIHLTQGEDRHALRSLGLRAGVPFGVYAITGVAWALSGDDDLDGVWIPTAASGVVAALIDSMLATTSEPEDSERAMFLRFCGSF